MKTVDMLEWVMGWPWPVIIGIVVLIALGIARIVFWDKKDLSQEQSACPIPGKHCVCQCEYR